MGVAGIKVVTADDVAPEALDELFRGYYKAEKCEFLRDHGAWWHQGNQHRLVVVSGNEVAAYSALVPVRCAIRGQIVRALWLIDVLVKPKFRGRGLQTLLDGEICRAADLILGFPNMLAAKIHRKHGWGVREDLRVLMLTLRPLGVKGVRAAAGARGIGLRIAAGLAIPAAALVRPWLSHYQPSTARRIMSPAADFLARIFLTHRPPGQITTHRDADYIQWRYLNAPYGPQLAYYVAGPTDTPSQCLVTRLVDFQGARALRILDLFGHLSDRAGLHDILRLAVRDAVHQGASQVTVMTTTPELSRTLRQIGFWISARLRFCWHSPSREMMQTLAGGYHWTLADSDNDPPY